jgi:glycerophosphoryl diester phosphodiesterase
VGGLLLNTSAWALLVDALRDLRRTWPQMVLTDLLARILAVILIAPAVGLLIKLFLSRTATGVVTDESIASFLVHPLGLTALIVVGAVSVGVLFAETGQLMVIGFGAIEDRRVTWLDAFAYSYRRAVALVQLAGLALVRLMVISVPFLAAVGGIYWLLIRTHDINYYLARKPPEFMAALVAAGLLMVLLAFIVTSKIAAWLLSVPMVLFEGMSGRRALQASQKTTRTNRGKLTLWLVGWFLAASALSGYSSASARSSSSAVLPIWLFRSLSPCSSRSSSCVSTGPWQDPASCGRRSPRPGRWVTAHRSRCPGRESSQWLSFCSWWPGSVFPWRSTIPIGRIPRRSSPTAAAPSWHPRTRERAITDGADWLELDVQENADGEVIVAHDRDFMRSAGSGLEVWNATSNDLAELDIGSSFAPEFSDQRVPTLHQVLELAKGRVGIFIELKYYGHDVNLEQKVVDLVEETGMTSHIVIMSLNYDGVLKAAALRPDWTCGLLNAVAIGDVTRLDVDFLALTGKATTVSMIRRTHRREMKIYPWTINNPAQMWVMMSRGADGIITDRVALANYVKARSGCWKA